MISIIREKTQNTAVNHFKGDDVAHDITAVAYDASSDCSYSKPLCSYPSGHILMYYGLTL